MVSPMMVSPLLVQQLRTKYVLCDSDFSSSIWQQQQQQQQSTINNKKTTAINNQHKITIHKNQQPTINPPKQAVKSPRFFCFFPMVKSTSSSTALALISKPRLKPQVVTFNAMISSCGSGVNSVGCFRK